jgi:hypothetical protein
MSVARTSHVKHFISWPPVRDHAFGPPALKGAPIDINAIKFLECLEGDRMLVMTPGAIEVLKSGECLVELPGVDWEWLRSRSNSLENIGRSACPRRQMDCGEQPQWVHGHRSFDEISAQGDNRTAYLQAPP